MNTSKMEYTCEHDHSNGHVMRLLWGMDPTQPIVELHVCFTTAQIAILVNGEKNDGYRADDMSIEDFEKVIENCQQCYDDMMKFAGELAEEESMINGLY